jgi:hypothetical protein
MVGVVWVGGEAMKEKIAVGICLVSALAAIAAIRAGLSLTEVISWLALTWYCTSTWVSRLPRYWDKTFPELFKIARQGGLSDSRVASTISWGGTVLVVIFFVALFRQ